MYRISWDNTQNILYGMIVLWVPYHTVFCHHNSFLMWPWRFADSILFDVFSVKSVWCWCELWTLVLTPTSNQLLQLDCRVTVISFRGVHLSSSQYFISQNSCTLLCFCNRRGHILYDNEYILVTSPFTRLPKNVVYARLVAGTLDNVFKIGRNAKPRLIF